MMEQRRRGQMPGARRRQLDRQWQPIQPLTDGSDGRGVRRGQGEVWLHRLSSRDEQLDSRGRAHLRHRRGCLGIRKRQWRDRKVLLAGDAQHGAAGGQNAQVGAGNQDLGDERCRVEQVLQVIEDQEQMFASESRDQRLGEWEAPASRTPRLWAIAEATSAGSGTAASGTKTAPSANSDSSLAAASRASRVLPTPPGPVSVSRRTSGRHKRPVNVVTSRSRPTSAVSGVGNGPSRSLVEGPGRA